MIPYSEQRACAERELDRRCKSFPKHVTLGTITQERCNAEIEGMAAIVETLKRQEQLDEITKEMLAEPPLAVRPVEGELGRFFVQSQSRSDVEFLVDITEYDGNGSCGCEHFQCRLEPLVKQGNSLRCKHLEAAFEYAGIAI